MEHNYASYNSWNKCQDSILTIVTELQAEKSGVWIPVGSPPLFNRYQALFPLRYSSWGMRLITHLHLVSTLRMSSYIPHFPLYAFMVCVGVTLPSLFTNCITLWSLFPPPSEGFTCMHNMNTSSSLYQLNAHIYLYSNIFPTFLLHVSLCYTPSSGWAIHISAQNHMFFTRLLSMVTCVIGYKMHTIYIYIYIYTHTHNDWHNIL